MLNAPATPIPFCKCRILNYMFIFGPLWPIAFRTFSLDIS